MNTIPIHNKYNLTVAEAMQYFNLGETKIRELVRKSLEHEIDVDFVLVNGRRTLIKRQLFEDYLAEVSEI